MTHGAQPGTGALLSIPHLDDLALLFGTQSVELGLGLRRRASGATQRRGAVGHAAEEWMKAGQQKD